MIKSFSYCYGVFILVLAAGIAILTKKTLHCQNIIMSEYKIGEVNWEIESYEEECKNKGGRLFILGQGDLKIICQLMDLIGFGNAKFNFRIFYCHFKHKPQYIRTSSLLIQDQNEYKTELTQRYIDQHFSIIEFDAKMSDIDISSPLKIKILFFGSDDQQDCENIDSFIQDLDINSLISKDERQNQ